jgi:hypothetical protein
MNKLKNMLGMALMATALAATPAWAVKHITPTHTNIAAVIGHSVTANDISKAFRNCTASRGWRFSSNGPGKLIGKLNVRSKHFVEVDVAYNSAAYTITYRNSTNMKYDPARNTIHKRYISWVENLDNDVQFCLR